MPHLTRANMILSQDALKLMKQGYYMAKVDLESAYRSVRIHPDNYQATGIKFKFPGNQSSTYMYDTRLPFGARKSPEFGLAKS